MLDEARELIHKMQGLRDDAIGRAQVEQILADAELNLLRKHDEAMNYALSAESYGDSEREAGREEDLATNRDVALPEERRRIRESESVSWRTRIQGPQITGRSEPDLAANPTEKVVVFATYLGSVEGLQKAIVQRFPSQGVEVLKGGDHGSKTAAQRRFRRPDGPNVLVCTAAGREGINLQFARILFNFDLPWNPMDLEQRIGRIHRYGQRDTAQVYNFVTTDMDEWRYAPSNRRVTELTIHQQLSLALEDKLAFTITATASYAEAAALAQKWGVPVTDSLLHSLTQRLGSRAETQKQEQLKTPPVEQEPKRAPAKLGVLMLDGWQVRQRGAGWGKRKTKENRVEWHEWKTGVYYPQEKSARTAGARGVIEGKLVIGWQGDPVEFGRRLHWEALRGGLGRARARLVVGDGAAWIWNVAQTDGRDPPSCSTSIMPVNTSGVWAAPSTGTMKQPRRDGPNPSPPTAAWVREGALAKIAALQVPKGEAGKAVLREQNYFASHSGRMNYRTIHRRGWPIGLGTVESACRQRQCRFKRPGQFWTPEGMRHLSALTEARHNNHWDELWNTN